MGTGRATALWSPKKGDFGVSGALVQVPLDKEEEGDLRATTEVKMLKSGLGDLGEASVIGLEIDPSRRQESFLLQLHTGRRGKGY